MAGKDATAFSQDPATPLNKLNLGHRWTLLSQTMLAKGQGSSHLSSTTMAALQNASAAENQVTLAPSANAGITCTIRAGDQATLQMHARAILRRFTS